MSPPASCKIDACWSSEVDNLSWAHPKVVMQIQHIDIIVSSHESVAAGDFAAPVPSVAEHELPCIGTSGIWDAWIAPLSNLQDLASLAMIEVRPIPDDSRHVLLRVQASEAEKRVGLRVYVLSH